MSDYGENSESELPVDRDTDSQADHNSVTSSGRRRPRRANREEAPAKGNGKGPKKYRGGAIAPAPPFGGAIEPSEPRAFERWERALTIWERTHADRAPPNELALLALGALTGTASLEVEDTPIERYDCADGLDNLKQDMAVFREKETMLKTELVREYENITRQSGEHIYAFLLRFIRLERRLRRTECLNILKNPEPSSC